MCAAAEAGRGIVLTPAGQAVVRSAAYVLQALAWRDEPLTGTGLAGSCVVTSQNQSAAAPEISRNPPPGR